MVDPIFKAPTPPPMNEPEASAPAQNVPPVQEPVPEAAPVASENVATATNKTDFASKKEQILARLDELKAQMIRYFWYSVGGLFLLGAFFGCAMSGSDSVPQTAPTNKGISARVIKNNDKKRPLPICGSVMAQEACLFYILNSSGHDKLARDFIEDVMALTDRTRLSLTTNNSLYMNQMIKTGYFAEIIVPAKN